MTLELGVIPLTPGPINVIINHTCAFFSGKEIITYRVLWNLKLFLNPNRIFSLRSVDLCIIIMLAGRLNINVCKCTGRVGLALRPSREVFPSEKVEHCLFTEGRIKKLEKKRKHKRKL
jgi:hypothetical protein